MPVSVCESGVSVALRESIANSSSSYTNSLSHGQKLNLVESDNIQNKLLTSAKKILLSKIEYEEVNCNQSVFDTLKSKYMVLKPFGKLNSQQQQYTSNDRDLKQNTATPNVFATTSGINHQNGHRSQIELPQPKKILFPRENVQIGWRNTCRKWQVGAGMMNVGNTCYLNSTLQAIFHVPAMANWLISDSLHREKCEDESGSQGGCIICAMSKTLLASQSNQSAIRPFLVYNKLKLICKHLIMGRQEDAHEFLRYLVEAMEKSYLFRNRNNKELDQYSKETTPLNQILGGYLRSAVRCLACGHVSTTFQHFQDLLLDIRKANTVEEALDGYFSRERLEDMGYKCEACKKKVSATKQFSLERAPVSLCVQLKRFSMMGTKLNKHIALRPRLDLSKYSSKKNGETLNYKIVAMVTHLGASQHCGHYTAIGLTDSGSYYQFDDSCVRPISLQNVLNTNAYIIFYELDESHPNSRQTSTQVSGEHENLKENFATVKNGHKINNEVSQNNQKQNMFSTNNHNQTADSNTTATSSRIIGPQLPDGYKLATNNSSSSNYNFSKLANSPNKLNKSDEISPNQKHLLSPSATTSSMTDRTASSNEFNCQNSNDYTKSICKTKLIKNELNDQSDNDRNKSTDTRATLPSMPKLESSPSEVFENNNSSHSKMIISPNKSIVNNNKNHLGQNGIVSKSPIKSLVPYESDDDDDDEDDCNSDDELSKKNSTMVKNCNKTDDENKTNCSNSLGKRNCIDNSSDTETKRSRPTPPSPPIIKTKAGLWQVTSIDSKKDTIPSAKFVTSHQVKLNDGKISVERRNNVFANNTGLKSDSERKNPFASSTSSSSYPSSGPNLIKLNSMRKLEQNSRKIQIDRGNTVTELLKHSYRGYGNTVFNWNGQVSDMNKEVMTETRLERQREVEDDEENEMDRGKQKKLKIYGPHRLDNPGYNPFQEQQLQNNQHRRWNSVGNNNGRFPHQNNGYNKNLSYNRNNNFRRNKFQQQRLHHQSRNGGWR